MSDLQTSARIPVVAIVGRPNVGKSSLFNRICGQRLAIVHDKPGTTRDRVSIRVQHEGRTFELFDTGGMGVEDVDKLTDDIELQIEQALSEASLIIFVTDVREGIMPLDSYVARRLRLTDAPVILVVNKVDSHVQEPDVGAFHALGFGLPHAISAREGFGTLDLLDRIVKELPDAMRDESRELHAVKLAVVGRRNVGKSTLINHLIGSLRVIVSDVPGTTRDAVDAPFDYEGLPYVGIDTAGVRKKRKVQGSFEYYSQDRARRAVTRADVVILMLDAREPIGKVEKDLARYVIDECKPVVIAVNKWDLVEEIATGQFRAYLDDALPGLAFAPLTFISASKGENIPGMMKVVRSLFAQGSVRVTTGRLNDAVNHIVQVNQPPVKFNRRGRIYYATQVTIQPPTIVMFVNDPKLFSASYEHYLGNGLRSRLPYAEIPLRIQFRRHNVPK